MAKMEKLLCCDWGTSAFRLTLIDRSTARILAVDKADQGIARTFELWQKQTEPATDRKTFYLDYIQSRIVLLEQQLKISLKEVPIVISGMASSSIGIAELPYKELPFAITGADLLVNKHVNELYPDHEVFLISGVRSKMDDVMRGEETLLAGSLPDQKGDIERLCIFPGTHSKHVRIKNRQAVSLQTFMTGEFFDLLTHHSMLTHSVSENDNFQDPGMKMNFENGILKGIASNLLHSCFNVRTNSLFHLCNPPENYYYLSGLLIGHELKELVNKEINITLVCGAFLRGLYETAFNVLNHTGSCLSYKFVPEEEALVRGQLNIYNALNKHS